jgi:DNA repair protein RadC
MLPPFARRYHLRVATWTVVREPGAALLPRKLSRPEDAVEIARAWFTAHDDDRERFIALHLDTQNNLRLLHEVSVGTQNSSLAHPREVFGPALREGACALIVAHNHPSGEATPSPEDVRLTKQLAEAGKLLNVPLHDHLIVGNGTWQWTSLAQRGVL